jgi:hypothetical protein
VAATSSFIDPQNGDLATAEHVAQLVEDFQGLRNIPISLSGINDAATYALTLKNAGTGSRDLIAYAADGTTVLLQVDATGVTLGSPVNVPPGSISGSAIAAGSISNSMLGADVARDSLLTNGGFEIWQRGTGPFTGAGTAFGPDRYGMSLAGTDTLSVSRNTANVDVGSSFCAACTFVLGTGAGATALFQALKAADGSQLAGRTVSASCRISTSVANAVRVALTYDGTGGSTSYSAFHTGGGAYQTLTLTVTIPANATLVQMAVYFAASCTAYLDNANLVVGSQPANYVPMHPADDLARCQRYYEIVGAGGSLLHAGWAGAASEAIASVLRWRAFKAVTPTVTKVGTWAPTGAAEPVVAAAGQDGTQFYALSIGVNHVQFASSSTAYISSEANP